MTKEIPDYNEILEKARALIEKEKPGASIQKKAAFANGVAYLTTGWSGGYGGPSVREHAVNAVVSRLGVPGEIEFDAAVKELIKDDGVVFGPITDLHRMIYEDDHCFDDDPEDLRILRS